MLQAAALARRNLKRFARALARPLPAAAIRRRARVCTQHAQRELPLRSGVAPGKFERARLGAIWQ